MRFLHTSDWHIGKTLKGHSRLDEQTAVMKEIVDIARREAVDAVLIAGDLYETSAPSAQSQQLLVHTLIELRRTGAEVIAMAGNHDHAATFDAYRALMAAAGIHLLGRPRPVDNGGLVGFDARSTGERVNVAVLPFLTTRYAVRAAELLTGSPADHTSSYDEQVRAMINHLKTGFTDGAVNIVMAHLTTLGGALGGGERAAQTIFDYYVPASIFGTEPNYVALGHLHRRQQLPAPCPVHYSGSPIALDFGEADNDPMILLVDVAPTTPAVVTEISITGGRRLRTVRATVAQLAADADSFGNDYLRVFVAEPSRAGVRDEVVGLLPNTLEVRIDPEFAAPSASPTAPDRTGLSPIDLFGEFCVERRIEDPRLTALFVDLLDELSSSPLDEV